MAQEQLSKAAVGVNVKRVAMSCCQYAASSGISGFNTIRFAITSPSATFSHKLHTPTQVTMQPHQVPQQQPTTSSPLAPLLNDAGATQETAMDFEDNTMDVSVDDVSDALQDLGTATDAAMAVVELDDEEAEDDSEEDDDDGEEANEHQAIEDIDMDGDDSDSDYDFDQDLENFDEEDDNDEVDEDERYHYFESLVKEIEAANEAKSDLYVMNMLAQRDRMTGEEAAWVDQFIKEQEVWKQKTGKSVDDYSLLERLVKFIPDKLERKRPVRATRK